MKDSSVGPVRLFDPRRQKRLLEGLANRFRSCLDQQRVLRSQHGQDVVTEESDHVAKRGQRMEECRAQRRAMLDHWDIAEERMTSHYEATAIKNREDLNRLASLFRRKSSEETKAIERKVEARRQAVLQQHENQKNQPGLQNRKEIKLVDHALAKIHDELERARKLTVSRLDRLPNVPVAAVQDQESDSGAPDSVEQTIDTIHRLTRDCNDVVQQMQTGAAHRIIDSYYVPIGVVLTIVVWSVAAFFYFEKIPPSPWMEIAIGAIVIGVIGFIVYAILMWPLKKMTLRLYPRVEHIGRAAEECAVAGRKISAKTAADAAAELIRRRDTNIESTLRWRTEQIAALAIRLKNEQDARRSVLVDNLAKANDDYTQQFSEIGAEMRSKAEVLAKKITDSIADTDRMLDQNRDRSAAGRNSQLQRLSDRLREGVSRGMNRIMAAEAQVRRRFPDWDEVLASDTLCCDDNVEYLPLGRLRVDRSLRDVLQGKAGSSAIGEPTTGSPAAIENGAAPLADAKIPESIPVVMHRRLHSAVVIRAPHSFMDQAVEMSHQILWRLISGAAPSRAKLTLIDPLGRGQHFTSFMALADHDPSLVGHRVWTTDSKIDARLAELAHHVEDVLQSSLRDRFERIEDYNEVAGSMAEPYRLVAAVGLPEGLTRDSYKHLVALIESGLRCGIFTILVCDDSKPWPADMPIPENDKIIQLSIDSSGHWHLDSEGLESLPFEPALSPPAKMRNQLVKNIGTAAVAASRVEIPLDNLLSAADEGMGSTADGIEIVIGSQGANRSLALDLGEGVRQHVLIAGKTGSGKSTLLHSIISSAAYRYRADQLHFYLLDFKKGVEFKSYADAELPHARVIGIESEREFGRSVLQRLDEELQHRGEAFRACGVQDLSEYRQDSGKSLPRIMLIIDEFQELFVRDDRLAGDCAMLLDRLVRQGRSFGMHVVLSSQSLAGAYSLPRATLGQMAVRIAMQCSESDAAIILADDNTAARLINRPGEAIYNDAGGLIEGNQPFQVAWLSSKDHREMLQGIAARDASYAAELTPPVIFEGNRPCRWTRALANSAIATADGSGMTGLLGESVEIGPPLALQLSRNTGRNVLLITPTESRGAILASTLSGFAKSNPKLQVVYLDGNRADDSQSLMPWLEDSGIHAKVVRPRDSESELIQLAEVVKQRGDDAKNVDPMVVVIDPLERFRDVRQDESFNFSLDAASAGASGAGALQEILRDGPNANVFVFLVCGSSETLSRWLPRASQHDLELRILGRMNATDSSMLIDTPLAADLSAATMLLYDDSDGRITKFRQCDLPDPQSVQQWLDR